ncbi:MAG TPA: tRNA epoxyqueuosine(34) reductase QueG [Candidatus Polarisedimenticolia bacterium]|jgi:epoxyqueuosine reductase|nr:tRNA epoxyqueuosine(34) reductase QueG [Candidatus Polarisedimenticolia bacterium]
MHRQERIRTEGLRLGFSRIGFAAARERPESARLAEWLRRGYAGEMSWLDRRRRERCDPTVLAPWVRGLVLASLPYSGSPPAAPPGAARISRYARGGDYHRVVRDRLVALGGVVTDAFPGARVRPVVDTAAVLEKPWAAEAGLGWQGKHTNLIDPDSGSWMFLGEILTDAELESDEPAVTDRCGTCTRCLEACPTGAFPEPYVLDSRRCISYLTIEHKGSIPLDLRPGLGSWVFGCDVCQEVCPWNREAEEGDPSWAAGSEPPPLRDLMEMSREQFNRRFAGTALRRTGWSRLLRNAAVALGNSRSEDAVPVLEKALQIPDPLVQEHVTWALAHLRKSLAAGPASSAAKAR